MVPKLYPNNSVFNMVVDIWEGDKKIGSGVIRFSSISGTIPQLDIYEPNELPEGFYEIKPRIDK